MFLKSGHRASKQTGLHDDTTGAVRFKRILVAAVAACLAFTEVGASVALAEDYVLGPQDKLRIRVFEWRPATGTAFEWTPLNGEFVVSAAGNLSLPIIGNVPATGLTVNQLSDSIGEHLKDQVGLQKRPNSSVEVSEYRPFFITGLVMKPGRYSYSPGLTVIQAISMAGGLPGITDVSLMGAQRDVLTTRGQIRALNGERLELLARQARVEAVLNDQASISFPPELTAHPGQPLLERVMAEEVDLFRTREQSINAIIASLNEAKVLATNQIDALKSKGVSLAKQIAMADKDVGTVNKLVSAGLTVSSRSMGANQNLADLESRNLDVSIASLKAQQDVSKTDRDIADARNRYRVDALTEAADIRTRLADNAEKTQTARALLENIAKHAPLALDVNGDEAPPVIQVTIDRTVNGRLESRVASNNDTVDAGDVIRVDQLRIETSKSQ